MKYQTSRFGEIEVSDEKVIEFPFGVIGYEKETKMIVLKHRPDSSFFWLQSLTNPELAFSLLSPFAYISDYKPKLRTEEIKFLGALEQNELEFYGMVVIPQNHKLMTINLLSPVVINSKKQKGMQIVLSDTSYSVHHRLIPDTEASSNVST